MITAATHAIRLTATGKSAAATSYEISADAFTFVLQSGGGGQVATPTFTPDAGAYTNAQNVSITTATSGASIRFTTDGSTPSSSNGVVHTGPVNVNSSATLKAIGYMGAMTNSPVATASYTINDATPAFRFPPGVPIFVGATEPGPISAGVQDLQRDLQKVLGTSSPVVNTEPTGPAIVVTCQGTATASWRDASLTNREGHLISARGTAAAPRIVLQGADVRGALYAIYEFSDRYLNVPQLWYWASWLIWCPSSDQRDHYPTPDTTSHTFSNYQSGPFLRK